MARNYHWEFFKRDGSNWKLARWNSRSKGAHRAFNSLLGIKLFAQRESRLNKKVRNSNEHIQFILPILPTCSNSKHGCFLCQLVWQWSRIIIRQGRRLPKCSGNYYFVKERKRRTRGDNPTRPPKRVNTSRVLLVEENVWNSWKLLDENKAVIVISRGARTASWTT